MPSLINFHLKPGNVRTMRKPINLQFGAVFIDTLMVSLFPCARYSMVPFGSQLSMPEYN